MKTLQTQTYLFLMILKFKLNLAQMSDKVRTLKVKHKKLRVQTDEQGWKRLRMRREGFRIGGVKTIQVTRESGVIRLRVILRSSALNSRGKDYHPGRHSKTKKSGSWLSG